LQVIQYLENNYLSEIHAGGESAGGNSTLDMQAKTYVVDILASIAGDIESLATNLNTYVGAQADAVDALGTQMEVVRSRLAMSKAAVALERFDEMRTARPVQNTQAPPALESVKEGDDDASEGSTESGGEDARQETQAFYAGPSFGASGRVSIEERLRRLDEVGVCLKKETVRTQSSSVTNFLANPMIAASAPRASVSGAAKT
jgi:hypothetical protein